LLKSNNSVLLFKLSAINIVIEFRLDRVISFFNFCFATIVALIFRYIIKSFIATRL